MSAVDPQRPEVVEGELVSLVDVMPRPLQYPPAVRHTCACGKDGTPYSHGATETRPPLSCAEVLAIRARVEADVAREQRPGLLTRLLRRGGAR